RSLRVRTFAGAGGRVATRAIPGEQGLAPLERSGVLRARGRHRKGQVRTSVTTNESDLARAPCGDLTRVGRIPGMALRQYAGRYDRHASDSAKMAVCRLEAR